MSNKTLIELYLEYAIEYKILFTESHNTRMKAMYHKIFEAMPSLYYGGSIVIVIP